MMVGALTVAATVAAAPGAVAQEKGKEPDADPRGYVDGSRLRERAGPEGLMREVSLRGPILQMLGETYARRGNEEMAELVGNLESIEAVVTKPNNDDDARASRVMADQILFELKKGGWIRIAVVRTDEAAVEAYVLLYTGDIVGLTILVQTKPDQFAFVNLAGYIELDQLSLVSDVLDMPELLSDALGMPGLVRETRAIETFRAASRDAADGADDTAADGRSEKPRQPKKPGS